MIPSSPKRQEENADPLKTMTGKRALRYLMMIKLKSILLFRQEEPNANARFKRRHGVFIRNPYVVVVTIDITAIKDGILVRVHGEDRPADLGHVSSLDYLGSGEND